MASTMLLSRHPPSATTVSTCPSYFLCSSQLAQPASPAGEKKHEISELIVYVATNPGYCLARLAAMALTGLQPNTAIGSRF